MDKLIKTIRENEKIVLLILPIMMALIFAFLPIADVFGKTTANGIKIVFDGKGLGFSRLCATLVLLLPIFAVMLQFVKIKLPAVIESRFNFIWAAASLIFVVLMAIAFPQGVSLTWGGYIYCLLAVAGIGIDLMPKR